GSFVEATSYSGSFGTTQIASVSPTLQFDVAPLGNERYHLSATRANNAYSQYGRDENQQEAGQALFKLAAAGPAAAQGLFQALDFSATDGSQISVALDQISPAGYSAALAASLMHERSIMQTARQGLSQSMLRPGTDWQGYALVFGACGDQITRGSMLGDDA